MAGKAVPYWHVDAFAERPFAGNQAAVLLFESWPDDEVLQAIAAENMFAETAFLVPDDSGEAQWELRWFTPACEVRLCGHATLASGHVVLRRDGGEHVRFRTRQSGVLEVRRAEAGYALALPAIAVEETAQGEAAALLGDALPQRSWRSPFGYSVFLYAAAAEVRALAPRLRELARFGPELFVCTAPGEGDPSGAEIVSRVFAPGAGVDEDPVTGTAHALVTPIWAELLGRDRFTAYQASPRGGRLSCRLDGERVWLGGGCVTVVEGGFYL